MIRDYKDKDTAGQHSPLATPTPHTQHTLADIMNFALSSSNYDLASMLIIALQEA